MNSFLKRIRSFIDRTRKNPWNIFWKFNFTKISRLLPDKIFLKLIFRARLGYRLDLENPTTFNEKLQWLKMNDRKPSYTKMVDKYEAKKIIESKLGNEYVVPTYGIYDDFSQIDFSTLPKSFVLKTTHDAGNVLLVDGHINRLDLEKAEKQFSDGLKRSFYWQGREWPYKYVKPRIIAEEYLKYPDSSSEISDYKVMCFNGKAIYCYVCSGRHSPEGVCITFFDREWNRMPFRRPNHPQADNIARPKNYEKMLFLAEKLAADMVFLRVDFYEVGDRLYVGEMTLFPGNGFEKFEPEEWDKKLGTLIILPIH